MNLPSWSELCRCSPRSQPNTLSLRIPRWRSFWGGGRDFINVLRNVISFPCFLHTGPDNANNLKITKKSLGGNFESIIQKRHLALAQNSEHCRGSCHLSVRRSCRERSPPARGRSSKCGDKEEGREAAGRMSFFCLNSRLRHSASTENPSSLFIKCKIHTKK